MASRIRAFSSFSLFFLFFAFSEAKDFIVGGKSNAWEIPSSTNALNQWAEQNRFQIGDTLVWKYNGEKDSVLQVTSKDYQSCNTSNPIEIHKDGNTVVKFDRSGPYYFISGAQGHCEKGQKLVVVVMTPRSIALSPSDSPANSPVGTEEPAGSPAIAPTSSASRLAVFQGGFAATMVALLGSLVAIAF